MRYHLHHFRHLHCQLPLPTLLSLCFSSSFLSSSSSSSSSLFIMTTFLSSPLSLMTCCCCFSLDALDPDAYEAFQASNNLSDVVQRCLQKKHIKAGVLPGMSKKLSIRASLMTPVKPMLVCINGVNQDLLWRSKKNLWQLWRNCSKLYCYIWLCSKWQICIGSTSPSNVASNIEPISTYFAHNSSLFG